MKRVIQKGAGYWILLYMLMSVSHTLGQSPLSVSGRITDENGRPMRGAVVVLKPGPGFTVSNDEGVFRINSLNKGSYQISISFTGYHTYIDTLVPESDVWLEVALKVSFQTLQEVRVVSAYPEERKREMPVSIEIVNSEYIRQYLGGSLMASLGRLPGVTSVEIGSGQSKPVIRGLGFNRMVVVEHGIRHEGQQWGADHGLEIDQYAVDQAEIIKGPSSLLYGSEAIGGVIVLKGAPPPAAGTAGGQVDFTAASNNLLVGSSLNLYYRKSKWFATLRTTATDYADYRVPANHVDIYSYRAPLDGMRLRNTAGNEQNIHFSTGILSDRFSSRLFISFVSGKSGFFANAHGLEPRMVDTALHDNSARDIRMPFHEVQHLKVVSKNQWISAVNTFTMELGYQRNLRHEWSEYTDHGYMPSTFPESLPFPETLERMFLKDIWSGNLHLQTQLGKKLRLTSGLNSETQSNKIDGRNFIIPAYERQSLGVFIYGRYSPSHRDFLHAGLRYDVSRLQSESYFDWFESPVVVNGDTTGRKLQRAETLNRNFSTMTWAAGWNHNREQTSLKLNLGKSFRIPHARELAANGVNYHQFSFEMGDPSIKPEISYQADLGVEYYTRKFAIGVTPFVNYFKNYIYLNPTFGFDRLYGNGNQIFRYEQTQVMRFGGELHTHYDLTSFLHIGAMAEYVYSEQLSGAKKGFSVPFSPPLSALINLRASKAAAGPLHKPWFSIDLNLVAAQNRIVPPEEKTPGYNLVHIRMGTELWINRHMYSVAVQVNNIFNRKYFHHTSYYRLINAPEPGRNVMVNISVPFNIKQSK